jgi:predicted RNA-binding protein
MARYYILVGDADTWKISVANNLWGFSDKSKGSWGIIWLFTLQRQ